MVLDKLQFASTPIMLALVLLMLLLQMALQLSWQFLLSPLHLLR